ncbi:hypothetical protein BC6307_18090 [Sutcliffiella cohnii]|uniref:AAA+ ATPase domain-containing protein n=1 Tax=Sutcliffiella cohnii TaxID=33932 RepID=A0A223KU57_9BACI|nr:ATP-binding protein [Sutcliffiella cohnii]AST93031.1 hypothetical protein BC6307_18090 [Sutcliffiella cohnii]
MATQSMEEILKRLQLKTSQLQAEESDGLEKAKYDCPKCKDETGYIGYENGVEVWIRCTCISWRRANRLMKTSEITNEFKRLGFQNFDTENKPDVIKDAYECSLMYYQNFESIKKNRNNSIALLGQPGSGKTHLLMAISNNFIQKKHVPVLYFPFVEGFGDLKDDFDALEEKLEKMKKVNVLFIDDLFKPARGKPRATDWQIEQMYAVLNYRYLNHMPILVSSELSVDELCDIDEALGTRIYQMCQDYTVVIKGDRKQLNHRLVGAPS